MPTVRPVEVNNHVHTTFSFSPYTPAAAAERALAGRMINNPDSPGLMYVMLHGKPALLPALGLREIDFARDVRAISRADAGGTITERHLLFALAGRILETAGRGSRLPAWIVDRLGLAVPDRLAALLADPVNPFLACDLLGVLKSGFLGRVFLQPDHAECVPVADVVGLAVRVGAIPCYGYLGDVGESPTGDRKAERFEDAWLDELMVEAKRLGFRAVAYMPPQNTAAQLARIRGLCAAHGFMEVSGVDINSPRQSFNCPEVLRPESVHLVDATWALIAHEKLQAGGDRYALSNSSVTTVSSSPRCRFLPPGPSAGPGRRRRTGREIGATGAIARRTSRH